MEDTIAFQVQQLPERTGFEQSRRFGPDGKDRGPGPVVPVVTMRWFAQQVTIRAGAKGVPFASVEVLGDAAGYDTAEDAIRALWDNLPEPFQTSPDAPGRAEQEG